MRKQIEISTEFIKLDSFLKFCGACSTGGEAKEIIAAGKVLVNNETCLMRGKKLHLGDVVTLAGETYEVAACT